VQTRRASEETVVQHQTIQNRPKQEPEMTKILIIQGGTLDQWYEIGLNYLHQKYHTYPSNLQNLYVSQEQMHTDSMCKRLARDILVDAKVDAGRERNYDLNNYDDLQAIADYQGHGQIGKIVL
jgi:hypothetical protein